MLPWDSELVLAHEAQARVLARLHLGNEPAGKLRLGRASGVGGRKQGRSQKDFGQMKHMKSAKSTAETGRHPRGGWQITTMTNDNKTSIMLWIILNILDFLTRMPMNTGNPLTHNFHTLHKAAELVPHGEIIAVLQLPHERT